MQRGQSAAPVVLLIVLLVVVLGLLAFVSIPFASVLSDPPRVSLDTTQNVGASANESEAAVVFTHDGGDKLPSKDVYVVVDGERASNLENITVRYSAETFRIGEQIVVEQTDPSGLTGDERLALVYKRGDTEYRLRVVTVRDGGAE